jgi:hypothetical protein
VTYLVVLGSLIIVSLATGFWWFVSGTGEQRLTAVLKERFAG